MRSYRQNDFMPNARAIVRRGLRTLNGLSGDVDVKMPPFYDISHWITVNNWAAINPKPLLMGTKATEADDYKDPTFPEYFGKMRTVVGCRRLAYHFFRKNVDAVRQANWFVDYITPYITVDDVLALDFEEGGETAPQLWAFLNRVKQRRPNNLIIIYSRKNLMDPIVMTESEKAFFKTFPTWPAGYPTDPDPYTTTPPGYIPDQSKWGPCWAWQYSDDGVVQGFEGNNIDLNLLEPAFIKWLGGSVPPDPEPPDPPPGGTMYGKVIVGSLNIRAQPNSNNTTNPPIGLLQLNDIVEADSESNGWWLLKRITRAGVGVALPGPVCYAYEGTNNGYIQEIPQPPVQSGGPKSVLVEDANGKLWRSTTFTEFGP